MKNDPIRNPSITLLTKLGSLAVHVDEMLSETGHYFDIDVIKSVISDPEVKTWIEQMNNLGLLPLKRGQHKSE